MKHHLLFSVSFRSTGFRYQYVPKVIRVINTCGIFPYFIIETICFFSQTPYKVNMFFNYVYKYICSNLYVQLSQIVSKTRYSYYIISI